MSRVAKSACSKELVDKDLVEPSFSVKEAHVHPNVEDVEYKTLLCPVRPGSVNDSIAVDTDV